jgi:uncharacterized protein (UPF0548 family)
VAIQLLSPARAAELGSQSFTYAEVGATAGDLPDGYTVLRRTRDWSNGGFASSAQDLMSWAVQQRSGLRVATSSTVIAADAVAVLGVPIGPLVLSAPCRVVYVVDEPGRIGFAYGTLPGHPESGEEAFVLEQHVTGRLRLTITAFSRPATRLARLGGPVTGWMQRRITERYLLSLTP